MSGDHRDHCQPDRPVRTDIGRGPGAVRFLGCTLWTDFRGAEVYGTSRAEAMEQVAVRMNDVRRITVDGRALTNADVAAWHGRDLRWLAERLGEPFPGPTVVVTHHAPARTHATPRTRPARSSRTF